jgi:arylsulfatase
MSAVIQPNVLLIMVDQWPGNLLGVAGHPVIETPTIDNLAALGVRYTNAYSECPICIPARRSVMTGTTPRGHGDRVFQPSARMPNLPTLAQTFRDAGYQAYGVGKLHVYPARDRIGFDDVLIAEEGRPHLGAVDDYDIYLAEQGYAGQQFMHGMTNNDYVWRPWHLPQKTHQTNWKAREMAKMIKRRDPERPSFWHLSYTHPHPPLVPLSEYFERYARKEIPAARISDWSADDDALPYPLKGPRHYWPRLEGEQLADARRAFYAQCTHIDHSIRMVMGTLREEGLIDNTIIMLTSDHGDMLGDHGLYAKRVMLEGSNNIPMVLVDTANSDRVSSGVKDDRLVGLADVMPTLLEMAGIEIPKTVEGLSMIGDVTRTIFYGESLEGAKAMRMVRDDRYKLIWYPAGNAVQMFDLKKDREEISDIANDPNHADARTRLEAALISHLYGQDLEWVDDNKLVGMDAPEFTIEPNRNFFGQRGLHYPTPPRTDPAAKVGSP